MQEEQTYIHCEDELVISAGSYYITVNNRQADFILTLPGNKQIKDNLFQIEERLELYQLLGYEGEIYNWLLQIKEAIEEKYISKGASKMNLTYHAPRFVFTQNTTGMCTLTFHEQYKNDLSLLGLKFPIP